MIADNEKAGAAVIVAFQLACGGVWAASPDAVTTHTVKSHNRHAVTHARSNTAGAVSRAKVARRPANVRYTFANHAASVPPPAMVQPAAPTIDTSSDQSFSAPTLTPQQQRVGQLATRNGDQTFLMVDKARGRVILFEDGTPTFSGTALTGQSTTDVMPAGSLAEKFDDLNGLEYKVTPAGRFTITRNHTTEYGPVFDINEVHGKDWGIAIHQVWLGDPTEHRAARLRSANDRDRHITYGCINVSVETMRVLMERLPSQQAVALYVLPWDDNKTAAFFPWGTS